MKDKVAGMIWNETKWKEYQLYKHYMLMGSFISLVDEVVFDDCNDDKLVFAINELEDYLEDMMKKEVDKYHYYDARYRNLPQHKKVKYEVLAQNILDFVDKEGKQDEPFQFKYHYNILTGTEVNEKPKSWGSFYYNWKTRKG